MQKLLFILGFVSSQFYLFPSGTPQLSHVIMMAFSLVAFYLFIQRYYKLNIEILSKARPLIIFVFYTVVIDLIYTIIHQEIVFLKTTLFILFNISLYLGTLLLFQNSGKEGVKKFLERTAIVSIFILFFCAIFSIGRYDVGTRFNGFFNDPNQMAYWVVCVYCIFKLSCKKIKLSGFVLFMVVFIVLATKSRSGLLGLSVIGIAFVWEVAKYTKFYKILICLLLFVSTIFTFHFYDRNEVRLAYSDTGSTLSITDRIEKIDTKEQLRIRGYYRPIEYPEYLLFGAGKGLDHRFNSDHEIHSTWVGILFYYGIIGIGLFIVFYYRLIKSQNFQNILIIIAPLLYGMSTYGLRTPIFWIYLAAVTFYSLNVSSVKKLPQA